MGLIPARAGKTPQGHPRPSWRWAHPRACGENASLVVAESQNPGSSPRVRGKHWLDARVNAIQRLIPARAGKTPVGLAQSPGTQAHPRACGENFSLYDLQNLLPGSSPRVRGKLNTHMQRKHHERLIPARAGKTPAHLSHSHTTWGSSPRVRGKPFAWACCRTQSGLIPARAGKTIQLISPSKSAKAHPRACGENGSQGTSAPTLQGSSPRVRGKRVAPPQHRPQPRLIPARAGKTGLLGLRRRNDWAHPRACGENPPTAPGAPTTAGSSPRVRGKRDDGEAVQVDVRLIPARAGKTYLWRSTNEHGRAHPRACGENIPRPPQSIRSRGSSPRVRGKPREEAATIDMGGLIPARAGKTPLLHLRMLALWAHPRACGENEAGDEKGAVFEGSSPRVRGKQRNRPHQGRTGGLIPACAGKTHTRAQLGPPPPAHPRVCGENSYNKDKSSSDMGSSPRVRGKPCAFWGVGGVRGLIPACAGKTAPSPRRPGRSWAHPRVCGENRKALEENRAAWGSSPRVRGKRAVRRPLPAAGGLIPACAGKTKARCAVCLRVGAHPRVCGEN